MRVAVRVGLGWTNRRLLAEAAVQVALDETRLAHFCLAE
jgi:hypothetical protein